VSVAGAIAAFLTGFLGSSTPLLLSLRNNRPELSDLEERFAKCMEQKEDRKQKAEIISFHETKPTYLLGWFSIGLVSMNSSYINNRLTYLRLLPETRPGAKLPRTLLSILIIPALISASDGEISCIESSSEYWRSSDRTLS